MSSPGCRLVPGLYGAVFSLGLAAVLSFALVVRSLPRRAMSGAALSLFPPHSSTAGSLIGCSGSARGTSLLLLAVFALATSPLVRIFSGAFS